MPEHIFSFEGGEILTRMGASWFVSYAYYLKIDHSHRNWKKSATAKGRIANYNKSEKYHKARLERVLEMNPAQLNKNQIGMEAMDTKRMAKELLELKD